MSALSATGTDLVYGAVNRPVLSAIPLTARRVLDVGCGDGALGAAVKARQPAEVVGLTYSAAEAAAASARLDRVEVCDLNAPRLDGLGAFDCVVCSHVLEHLYWPDRLLAALHPHLAPGGLLVVALPNVLAWRQRLAFLLGRFRYTDGGAARELVTGSGYRLLSARGDGVFPLSRFLPLGGRLDRLAVRLLPGLFAWQVVMTAEHGGRS